MEATSRQLSYKKVYRFPSTCLVVIDSQETQVDGKDAAAITPLKIATWNVRTLRTRRKLENVIHEMKRKEINILELSETHWKNQGDFDSDNVRVI